MSSSISSNYMASMNKLCAINKKKGTYLVGFASLASYRIIIKQSEKIKKCQDLARELKKLWNMKGDDDTNCSFGPWDGNRKCQVEIDIEGSTETTSAKVLVKLAIIEDTRWPEDNWYLLDFSEKTS